MKAKQAGLTDEEAKSGFNQNMMATGLLSEKPAEFAKEHNRRWLASAFEAGDVVLHKPHAVCNPNRECRGYTDELLDPCVDYQSRPQQCHPPCHGSAILRFFQAV